MTGWRNAVLWLGLVGAFSPVVVDLLRHCAEEPWARYALVFGPLLAVCVRQSRAGARASADGYLWLAVGVLIELVAIRADALRMARPGLALAVIGLCRAFGFAPTRAAALALWLIPVPSMLLWFFSPQLEMAVPRLVVPWVGALGAPLSLQGSRVLGSSGVLVFRPSDGGLPLAALLSGLGWYAAVRVGSAPSLILRRTLVWAALAVPVQLVTVLLALGALAADLPSLAGFTLDNFWWLAAAAGIAWIELRPRMEQLGKPPLRSGA